jgi:hypothetical protein
MKRGNSRFGLGLALLCLPLAILALSCGGGGGGGGEGGGSSPSSPTAEMGSVAVLLADGPADSYEHIWITITEVSLVPQAGGSPEAIYQSSTGVTVDLLDLRNENYLLTLKNNVPAGVYSKIRLQVSDIQVVGDSAPCSRFDIDVKLPSGKIDLNPRQPFRVTAGGTISIRLDIDANKSINLHPAGQSGKCIFRPVVFVDIHEAAAVKPCPQILSGTITKLITSTPNQTTGFILSLEHNRGDLEVLLSGGTVIFDENGKAAAVGALQIGQQVKVRGSLGGSGKLEASLVVIGEVLVVNGKVDSAVVVPQTRLAPLPSSQFLFTPACYEGFVGQLTVKVEATKTLILADCNTAVGLDAIQPGLNAKIIGKFVSGTEQNTFNAVAILLKPNEVSGEIISSSPTQDGKQVTIGQQSGVGTNVFIPAGTPLYLEGDGTLSMDDLCIGRQVRILLDPSIFNPLTAKVVSVEPERREGTVSDINDSSRTFVLGSGQVSVPLTATILDTRGNKQQPVAFGDIDKGDKLVCFGLTACPSGSGFTGYIVLITDL